MHFTLLVYYNWLVKGSGVAYPIISKYIWNCHKTAVLVVLVDDNSSVKQYVKNEARSKKI